MATPADRVGVILGEDGEYYIPATQRPDGSWRKPKKVKQGYVPQDEVPVYETKGTQWLKSVPKCPGLVEEPKGDKLPMSKSAKKNAKRKEKKKLQDIVAEPFIKIEEPDFSEDSLSNRMQSTKISNIAVSQDTIVKKIKNLNKKLKQIADLETKIANGELDNPDPDQLGKIARKKQIQEEVEELELELVD